MAIFGIEGKPGSGKSFEAVAYHVLESLRKGRKVITNLPLNLEHFIFVFGQDVVDELIEIRTESLGFLQPKGRNNISPAGKGQPFSTLACYTDDWRNEQGQGAKFIIDECHFVIPKGGTSKDISNWYSMHRHHGFDIVLMTQSFSKVDRDITNMIELVYLVQKNTMLGDESSYTRKVKCGTQGSFVNTDTRKYNPEIYPFYKSHTGVGSDVNEAYALDVKGKWQSKTRRASIAFGIIGIIMLGFVFKSMATDKSPGQIEEPKQIVKSEIKSPTIEELNSRLLKLKDPNSANVLPVESTSSAAIDKEQLKAELKKEIESDNEVKKKLSKSHPFNAVDFHIKGRMSYDGYDDFLFVASRNGQKLFNLRLKDFYMAGYDIEVLGDCLVNISYKDIFYKHTTCDSPTISTASASAL